jgi:polyisoprenoid-binding protein YceI
MKTLKLFSALIVIFAMLNMVRCSEDDVTPSLVSVSGKITFTNASGATVNAPGAVVSLMGSSATIKTITDENGNYTFTRVDIGTYMLNAAYFTDNTNLAGRLDGLNFAPAEPVEVTVGTADVSQNLTLVSVGQSNAPAIDLNFDWNGTAFEKTGNWAFDQTHSPVQFEFSYRDNVADFMGGFSQLSQLTVNFDPANLASSSIVAEIDLTSVNTRSLGGRDPQLTGGTSFNPNSIVEKMGCIAGTFGITADGTLPSTITSAARYAKFTSTSIAAFGDGYVAKGNLVFHGETKPIELWFKTVEPWNNGAATPVLYSGFEGRFYMSKTDFAISSSSVGETIRIIISVVATKPA